MAAAIARSVHASPIIEKTIALSSWPPNAPARQQVDLIAMTHDRSAPGRVVVAIAVSIRIPCPVRQTAQKRLAAYSGQPVSDVRTQ
jgi:hypothetical protein